jgi:tripartite-type tricarboxylate transporter receptor subunit TctC
MEQLKVATGIDLAHAAYRGIGPAITDILGGQTQALFPGLAAALPHIKAGKMRALAVTGLKRHPLLPDVPTFEELGFKGFDGVQWYGIVGPRTCRPLSSRRSMARSTRCSPTRRSPSGCQPRRCNRCR